MAAAIGTLTPRVALTPGDQSAVVERSDDHGHSDLEWRDITGQPFAGAAPFAPGGHYPAFSPGCRLLACTEGATTRRCSPPAAPTPGSTEPSSRPQRPTWRNARARR